MPSVDRAGLEAGLDRMVEFGLLAGWATKPLGLYLIRYLDGTVVTPSVKEAAMFVVGASVTVSTLMEQGRVGPTRDAPPPGYVRADSLPHQATVQVRRVPSPQVDRPDEAPYRLPYLVEEDIVLWAEFEAAAARAEQAGVALEAELDAYSAGHLPVPFARPAYMAVQNARFARRLLAQATELGKQVLQASEANGLGAGEASDEDELY